jgi:hypothetical protein
VAEPRRAHDEYDERQWAGWQRGRVHVIALLEAARLAIVDPPDPNRLAIVDPLVPIRAHRSAKPRAVKEPNGIDDASAVNVNNPV